ncbi:MAG: hypothetical protein S0880_31835 [Actinomycetota bacterium]|nr:hypothetical protein [Actinomycetota bacterium]
MVGTSPVEVTPSACGGRRLAEERRERLGVGNVVELRAHRRARLAARRATVTDPACRLEVTERLVSRARVLRRQAHFLPELAAVALRRRASELELEAFVVETAASEGAWASR